MAKAHSIGTQGQGWHKQPLRHSNARRTGTAGGTYSKNQYGATAQFNVYSSSPQKALNYIQKYAIQKAPRELSTIELVEVKYGSFGKEKEININPQPHSFKKLDENYDDRLVAEYAVVGKAKNEKAFKKSLKKMFEGAEKKNISTGGDYLEDLEISKI